MPLGLSQKELTNFAIRELIHSFSTAAVIIAEKFFERYNSSVI